MLETGFPGLDLIRFGAALMVAIYHLAFVGPGRLGEQGERFLADFASAQAITASFWVAVQIFFVLSGVVIAFSAEGRSAGQFIRRRALRLYPAAWICATVTLLIWPKPDAALRYLRSLVLWPEGPWVSDIYWTMAMEITFYAMVAITLALGGSRWVTRLGAVLVLVSAGWWTLRVANLLAGDAFRPWVDYGNAADPILLLNHGCFFGLGILLYAIARRRSSLLVVLAMLGALTGLAAVVSVARGFAEGAADPAWRLLLPPGIWLLALAAMVVSLAPAARKAGRWPKAVRYVGLATYPLYLIHAELGVALMLVFEPLGSLPALLLALIGVLAVVAVIMKGEIWLRRLLDSSLRGARLPLRKPG